MKAWFQKIGYKLASWMYGRYGNDKLTYVLLISALVLSLLAYLPYCFFLYFIGMGLLIWSIIRTFSKNIPKRRRELERYMKIHNKFTGFFKLRKNKWRDRKTHVYFKCPKCRAVLRVPKGKGSITVTCPQCGERISKNT